MQNRIQHRLRNSLEGVPVYIGEVIGGCMPGRVERTCVRIYTLNNINTRNAGAGDEQVVIDHDTASAVYKPVAIA